MKVTCSVPIGNAATRPILPEKYYRCGPFCGPSSGEGICQAAARAIPENTLRLDLRLRSSQRVSDTSFGLSLLTGPFNLWHVYTGRKAVRSCRR